jgi:hypothetical protein
MLSSIITTSVKSVILGVDVGDLSLAKYYSKSGKQIAEL